MAEKPKLPEPKNPFLELSEDAVKRLGELKEMIDTVEARLEGAEEAGIDASRLREQIRGARKMYDFILKNRPAPK